MAATGPSGGGFVARMISFATATLVLLCYACNACYDILCQVSLIWSGRNGWPTLSMSLMVVLGDDGGREMLTVSIVATMATPQTVAAGGAQRS